MKTKTRHSQVASETTNRKPWLRLIPYVAGAGALAGGLFYARHWRKKHRREGQSAISAVTGGPPEDMNAMPPADFPAKEGPVYDGSQIERENQRSATAPRNAFREPA